jgi:hypothetical protein
MFDRKGDLALTPFAEVVDGLVRINTGSLFSFLSIVFMLSVSLLRACLDRSPLFLEQISRTLTFFRRRCSRA